MDTSPPGQRFDHLSRSSGVIAFHILQKRRIASGGPSTSGMGGSRPFALSSFNRATASISSSNCPGHWGMGQSTITGHPSRTGRPSGVGTSSRGGRGMTFEGGFVVTIGSL
jgi:hypothetical protein